jgi:PAS domain S-box-containing protein
MDDRAEPADPAAVLDSVAAPIVVYDREYRFAFANEAFCRSVYKSWEELAGRRVADVFPDAPERMDEVRARFDRVWAGETTRSAAQPYHIPGPDGRMEARYWRSVETPVRGPDGTVTHLVQAGEDITEEIRLRRQKDVIAEELQHRLSNTLAMVGSLAMLTGQHTPSVDAFVESFTDRLEAMGRNLAMISDHHWQGLPFRTIIEAELSQVVSLDDPRIRISGPDMLLSVRATKWMALLVHEMVTNAVRHGCFSIPGGMLSVTWQVDGDEFSSDWTETGRRESGEPGRKGFGSQLLGLMPNVRITREFHEGGMHVRTVAPSRFFSMSD